MLRRPHGRLIFTYHHWRPDAWIQLTMALKAAGFRLLNSYTVHSENPISVHIRHLKALKHDSILILQPKGPGASIQTVSRQQPTINCNESFSFCGDCAQLLGHCLDFELVASRKLSASMDQLFASFRNNPNIPSVKKFVEVLNRKITGETQIALHLGTSTKTPRIDIKAPTSSGRVREAPEDYPKEEPSDD